MGYSDSIAGRWRCPCPLATPCALWRHARQPHAGDHMNLPRRAPATPSRLRRSGSGSKGFQGPPMLSPVSIPPVEHTRSRETAHGAIRACGVAATPWGCGPWSLPTHGVARRPRARRRNPPPPAAQSRAPTRTAPVCPRPIRPLLRLGSPEAQNPTSAAGEPTSAGAKDCSNQSLQVLKPAATASISAGGRPLGKCTGMHPVPSVLGPAAPYSQRGHGGARPGRVGATQEECISNPHFTHRPKAPFLQHIQQRCTPTACTPTRTPACSQNPTEIHQLRPPPAHS